VRFGGVGALRDPAFRRYYTASALESAGAALTAVALPLVVYDRTRSASATALVPVLQVTPTLVFGLVAGAVADRLHRRVVMIAAAVVGAAALAGLAVSTAAGGNVVAGALACAGVVFTATVFFESAEFAAVPAMVGRDGVVEAQTLLQTTNRLMMVVVPASAAGLYGLVGPVPLFVADALVLAVSGVLLTTLPSGALESGGRVRKLAGLAGDIGDGLRYLWRHRLIRSLATIGTFNAVAGGAVAGVLVVYADRAFDVDPGNPALGAFYVAASVGSLVGGASLPLLRQRYRVVTITLLSLVASTVLMTLFALAPVLVIAVACYGLWQGVYGLIINNGQALRMQILPDEYQSRVGTAARMLGWGGSPLGALVAGFLADRVPIRWVLLVAVAALLGGVVLAARARALLADADPALGSPPEPAGPRRRGVHRGRRRVLTAALRGVPLDAATGIAVEAARTLAYEAATALANRAARAGLLPPRGDTAPRHRAGDEPANRIARPGPPGRHHRADRDRSVPGPPDA
jgi:MFS family permease